MSTTKRRAVGVQVRHKQGCPARDGARCRCRPSYRGQVWDPETKRPRKGPWMPTEAAARAWRVDATRAGRIIRDESRTIGEALLDVLDKAERGHVRNRSGATFKPSVLASYRNLVAARLVPRFGETPLGALTQPDLHAYVRDLLAEGLSPSTVRNCLMPLRIAYREAVAHGEVPANPVTGLRLPASAAKRDRIADPREAERLLAALPDEDRTLWATALYSGLRRGELMALRWRDVDAKAGVLRVDALRGSYDPRSGTFGPPKSKAAARAVPVIARLRPYLAKRGRADALVFGRDGDADRPFSSETAVTRARRAWAAADPPLTPLGLHEARHTFASYLIAAGANAKAVTTALGHSSVSITFDRYGHLFPGHEDELRGLLDAFLPVGQGDAP